MKLTEKQINVINTIVSVLSFWESTNDINSPSHSTLIKEELYSLNNKLDDYISDKDLEDIEENLLNILNIIRKNK